MIFRQLEVGETYEGVRFGKTVRAKVLIKYELTKDLLVQVEGHNRSAWWRPADIKSFKKAATT